MNKVNLKLTLLAFEIAVISVGGKPMLFLQGEPDFSATTVKLIKSCYEGRVKHIGMAGDIPDSFIASMSSDNPISTILITGNSTQASTRIHKLRVFIVTTLSSLELRKILVGMKNSRWWNHMAPVYVLASPGNEIECAEAFAVLWTAWMMNMLGAKFICNHAVEGPLIFMFNPYTQDASAPWEVEGIRGGLSNHPWTLFSRKFNRNLNVCDSIDFDQTRKTGGYVVRMSTLEQHSPTATNRFSEYSLLNMIIQTFSDHMNVTLEMIRHPPTESFGHIDEEGKGHGLLKDFTDGRSDLIPYATSLTTGANLTGIYPIMRARFFAVTQYTDYQTQWRRIIAAIDRPSRIGLCIVALVTVIFLKFALRQSLIIAVLNTLRMVCNSCFTKVPRDMGPRIFLACLFCFVVTMQALYQGQLSALLAKHVRYPNVNNQGDLNKSNYVLYGRSEDFAVFRGDYGDRFVGIDLGSRKCTDYVLRNSSIACVGFRDWLINDAIELKLHMSKKSVAQVFTFWPSREDWPLQNKATRHKFRYVESGLFDHHQSMTFENKVRNLEANENQGSGKNFKILTLDDLGFAFIILGFGLACATLSFLVEILSFERTSLSCVEADLRSRRPLISWC